MDTSKDYPYTVEDRGYKTPCWIWRGSTNSHGYGRLSVEGRVVGAHCYYYEKYKGPLPKQRVPDHRCRTRMCINPDHLEAVTLAVNARRATHVKLSMEKAREMRRLHEVDGVHPTILAKQYGVSDTVARGVVKYDSWKEGQE